VQEIPIGDAAQTLAVAPIRINIYQFPAARERRSDDANCTAKSRPDAMRRTHGE
jgi:hypothetical protein